MEGITLGTGELPFIYPAAGLAFHPPLFARRPPACVSSRVCSSACTGALVFFYGFVKLVLFGIMSLPMHSELVTEGFACDPFAGQSALTCQDIGQWSEWLLQPAPSHLSKQT